MKDLVSLMKNTYNLRLGQHVKLAALIKTIRVVCLELFKIGLKYALIDHKASRWYLH
jgi:hypothetical protein